MNGNPDRVNTSEDETLHSNHHDQGAVPISDAGVLEHAGLAVQDLNNTYITDPQLLTAAMPPGPPGEAINATIPDKSMTLAEGKRNLLRGTSNIGELMTPSYDTAAKCYELSGAFGQSCDESVRRTNPWDM